MLVYVCNQFGGYSPTQSGITRGGEYAPLSITEPLNILALIGLNCLPSLENVLNGWNVEHFEINTSQMAEMAFKWSVMVGENFEIYLSQMNIVAFKRYTMVGFFFEIYTSQTARMAFKLSTMVGEKI